jgi:glycosyltransferase involved in cell wall biosynthesis
MILAVNGRRLEGQRLGVGRYIEYLLRHWGAMLEPDELVDVFVREPIDRVALGLQPNVRTRQVGSRFTGLIWENGVLRWASRRSDVFFGPSYTTPIKHRVPTVVSMHSVPEVSEDQLHGLHGRVLAQAYRRAALDAATILVPSRSTGEAVVEFYDVPAERVRVIPLGVDAIFRPLHADELLRDVRRRYFGQDVPFILFAGKMSRRRNIPTLLRAFSAMKSQLSLPHRLLLLGPNHERLPLDDLLDALGIREVVVQDDGKFARHADLVPVYNAADLFVHPTLHDAFSIPVIEAFACGTPVVTVNKGGVGEIAQGYALTIEEPTVDALTAALSDVLTNPALADELRGKGIRRAADFSWTRTADETLQALRLVAAAA